MKSDTALIAHCANCAHYTEEWSPMPGESWDRCRASTSADGSKAYCGDKNSKNNCPDYRRSWNPLRRYVVVNQWWRPYM